MTRMTSYGIGVCMLLVAITGGCCDDKTIPKAIYDLQSPDSSDRNDAALKLAHCGSKATKAVPRLAQLLYDSNTGVQSAAAYALRKIDTPSAREALQSAIDQRDGKK